MDVWQKKNNKKILRERSEISKAVPYAEKALAGLEAGYKKSEKFRYKSVADLTQRIYEGIGQPDKVKSYQQKYDQADAKFVN